MVRVTPAQVARMLDVGVKTVHAWCRDGSIPASRVTATNKPDTGHFRIHMGDVIAFARSRHMAITGFVSRVYLFGCGPAMSESAPKDDRIVSVAATPFVAGRMIDDRFPGVVVIGDVWPLDCRVEVADMLVAVGHRVIVCDGVDKSIRERMSARVELVPWCRWAAVPVWATVNAKPGVRRG